MKSLSLALAACIGLSTPAWSLSCLRPDIVRTFEMARDSDAGFWIVQGELLPNGPIATPTPDKDGRYKENASATTAATFTGKGLQLDGSYAAFSRKIDVTIQCFAHWCGAAPLGTKVFAAIEVKDTGPELILDPCDSRVVPYSNEANQRLLQCVQNNRCLSEY